MNGWYDHRSIGFSTHLHQKGHKFKDESTKKKKKNNRTLSTCHNKELVRWLQNE